LNAPNSISARASLQIPLRELTALPRLPSWIRGLLLKGGRGRMGGGKEGKGKGGGKGG